MAGRHERLRNALDVRNSSAKRLLLSAVVVAASSSFLVVLVTSETGVDQDDPRAVLAQHDTSVLVNVASMQLALAQQCPGTRTRADIEERLRDLARFSDDGRIDFHWESDVRLRLSFAEPALNYEAQAVATPPPLGTLGLPLDEFCRVTM